MLSVLLISILILALRPALAEGPADELEAIRQKNLQTCLTGQFPMLCNRKLLHPEELKQVEAAERRRNLEICLTGQFPMLCDKSLLSQDQLSQTVNAEKLRNREVCLSGQFKMLCKYEWLSKEDLAKAKQAEAEFAERVKGLTNSPSVRARMRGTSGCEAGHWISSVSDDGDIVKLEDGSIWEIDSIDTIYSSLWLPLSEIVVCDDKLINTDDGETVGATRLR